MTKAIIFDLDNTLIDFTERKNLVIKEAVKAMIDAGLKEKFEPLHKEFSEFYWNEGIEDQRIFQKFLIKKYGKIDYKVLAHAILAYRRVNAGLLRPYPGVKRVLAKLREKYKLAILSDAPKLEAYLRLCALGLEDYFDVIITFDDTKVKKPSKKGFIAVEKALKIPLKECLMVGDNIERDIIGAKKLGLKTCFAKYASNGTVDADYVINDIDELVSVLG